MNDLSRGEFSQLTGLDVDTLQRYDEAGVLKPRATEETHVRYLVAQIDDAVVIRSLEMAGLPLSVIARELTEHGVIDADTAFQGHREAWLGTRIEGAIASERAAYALAMRNHAWDVRLVEAHSQPYVELSMEIPVPTPDDAASLAAANARVTALFTQLEAGLRDVSDVSTDPGNSYWTSFAGGKREDEVMVRAARAVVSERPDLVLLLGEGAITGTLPARRELTVERLISTEEPDLHFDPGLLAIIHHATAEGYDLDIHGLRQFAPVAVDEETIAVRLAVPIR